MSPTRRWRTLRPYAAIDARFDELGGQLTAEESQEADNYAQQLMDQYGSTYKANGIGLETLKPFERIQLKHTLLLTLVYGPDGETPVYDSDLTEHLDNKMYELAYYNIPLYNTSTFLPHPTTRRPRCCTLAQAAAASCSETQTARCPSRSAPWIAAASAALPDIYAVLGLHPRRGCFRRENPNRDRKRPDRCLYPRTVPPTPCAALCTARPLPCSTMPLPSSDDAHSPAAGVHAGRPAHPDPEAT